MKIECHRHGDAAAAPRPGEAADVTVTTCDAQGKPVSAEVSLAILPDDRAIDELGGQSLTTFFRSRDRAPQFQTASSIQFHYQPANRVIGTAEPEEDAPAVPPHIAPQRGIPVAEPAASPCRSVWRRHPAAIPSAPARRADDRSLILPSAAIPLATTEQPAASAAPAAQTANQRSESESTVSRIPRPMWSGYWNPAITTGPDGRATVSLTLPDDAANLTLVAKAITRETLHRPGTQHLVLKKDLSAVIHLPPAFTDGDEVELPVVVREPGPRPGNAGSDAQATSTASRRARRRFRREVSRPVGNELQDDHSPGAAADPGKRIPAVAAAGGVYGYRQGRGAKRRLPPHVPICLTARPVG